MVTWVVEKYGGSEPLRLLHVHTWEWAFGIVERAEAVSRSEDAKLEHGARGC
jgi:hypothetical protein